MNKEVTGGFKIVTVRSVPECVWERERERKTKKEKCYRQEPLMHSAKTGFGWWQNCKPFLFSIEKEKRKKEEGKKKKKKKRGGEGGAQVNIVQRTSSRQTNAAQCFSLLPPEPWSLPWRRRWWWSSRWWTARRTWRSPERPVTRRTYCPGSCTDDDVPSLAQIWTFPALLPERMMRGFPQRGPASCRQGHAFRITRITPSESPESHFQSHASRIIRITSRITLSESRFQSHHTKAVSL